MAEIQTDLYLGDCLEVLANFEEDSFDLIVTSPPYADRRVKTYGGVNPDEYVSWFMPRAEEFLRVLKPSGTFILNIKEKAVDGERHTYVLELILEMRRQGWLWTEEFVWHKKNSYPGKWPNRFRDAWERCLQFNINKQFSMYQDAVMVPMGDWAERRLKHLSETDQSRDTSKVGSGYGIKYIVSIKSGPKWGNSSQIAKLRDYFKRAKQILGANTSSTNVVAVNGCCYGKDRQPDKGDYLKLCGQRFWEFISGDENLYTDIIEPLGHQAKEKNEQLVQEYGKAINRFTFEFIEKFCDTDGNILWEEIVKFNSAGTTP